MRKFNRPSTNKNRFQDPKFKSDRPKFSRNWQSAKDFIAATDPAKVDTSEALLKSFTFSTVRAYPGEENDHLVKRFKRIVEAAGVLSEIKKREAYKSPGQKKRERQQKAMKNARKRKARQDKFLETKFSKKNDGK